MRHILPDQRHPPVSDCLIDPVHPLDQRQRSQLAFQMPLQMCGDQPAGLAAMRRRRCLRVLPVPVVQRGHQVQHALRRRHRSRRPAVHAHAAPGRDVERPVRSRRGAAGAFDQRRRPTRDSHGPQQVSVQHEFPGPAAVGHRPQRGHGQPVQRGHRRPLLPGQAFGGLQHRARAGVAAVVADDVGGERIDGLYLGDDVEISAGVQLNVDVRERFQPGPELAAGAPHALGHRAHQPVVAGEQSDDPVGLAELVLTQHHRSIPVQPHRYSLPLRSDRFRYAAPIFLYVMVTLARFPTLTQQLFQLASGTVTSDELVRRSLDAIAASQPTLNAFRVVLTEQALADAARADRKRAAGEQLPLLGIPIAVKDDVDVAGVPTRFGADGNDPARRPGLRSRAAAEGRRRRDRRQDQHLRVGPVAVHQRTGIRPHPQSVVSASTPRAARRAAAPRRWRPGWWPRRSGRTGRAASASPRRGRIWSASSRSGAGSPPGRCPRRSTASPSTACSPERSPMRRWCSTPHPATSTATCTSPRRCGYRITSAGPPAR